jgi:hypothetical protein
MNVTLPNGQVISGIPEGTTKEQVMQKAISAGLAVESDFARTAPKPDDVARNVGFQPTVVPEKKGFMQGIKDFVAGGEEGKRNIFAAPELNEMSMRAFKSGLGGLLTGDPKEIQQIIASNYPEAEFGDIDGQMAVRLPSGDYLLQPEGIDPLDVARFGTDVAAFTPAGRVVGTGAKQLAKGAVVAGMTQGALQGVEAVTGGEFDPEDVAIEAATQGAFQVAAPVVKAAATKVKESVSPIVSKVLSKFKAGDSAKPYEEAANALQNSNATNIMPQIMADPEVLKAADDLGINVNPSVYSTSDIYREMEIALKTLPQSKLSYNEKETIRKLGEAADNLVAEWTGTTDKSAISEEFTERMLTTVRSLEDEATALYSSFDDLVPKSTRLQPEKLDTLKYIKQQIEDLGGVEYLDPQLKQILQAFSQEAGPTQGLIDKFRKDVGSALKGQGPFKDASQSQLKQLYGALSEDSLKLPEFLGLADEVVAARTVVKQRKALEESLQGALGKDLSKSLMTELTTGIRGLQKGDPAKFSKIMNSIPDEDRQQVAISALNDIFSGGATKSKQFGLDGFVSSYEALQRNAKAADKLWQHVPPEVKDRMDSIYKVSKGLVEANRKDLNNPSGTARAVVGAMDAPNGILSKLFKVGGQMSAGAAATAPFDAGVTGAGFGLMNALRNAKTKATEAATDMITNPSFQEAMQKYIDGDSAAANSILTKLKSTGSWISDQPPEVKRAIARQGLIQYLTSEE